MFGQDLLVDMFCWMMGVFIVIALVGFGAVDSFAGSANFPAKRWDHRPPLECGVNDVLVDTLAKKLGGRGCVIKDGYVVKEWGDLSELGDWMSSVKPLFGTLLFFAMEEGLVKGVNDRIADLGWDLSLKDQDMTFLHVMNMTSGYARPEKPGMAWAYNDFAIQLYQKSLFDKVFRENATEVLRSRLRDLQFEDDIHFREDKPRLKASVRDFARLAWFWFQKGNWQGKQVLPKHYFDTYMRPLTPKDLPLSEGEDTGDYLGIESFGGGSAHFTKFGAGIYGCNWWFNDMGLLHNDQLTWPDAPKDTVMSIGAGGNNAVMIPSLNLVLVSAKGDWGKLDAGNADNLFNLHIKLLVDAAKSD